MLLEGMTSLGVNIQGMLKMKLHKVHTVFILCLLFSFISSITYASFFDTAQVLKAKDVMVGFGDGYMGWEETLTRAQAVKIIITAMNYASKADESVTLNPVFPDVKTSHWAFKFINLACEFDIVKGFPDGNFYPENQVTKAEYLVMLSRMYKALGGTYGDPSGLSIKPSWMAQEVLRVPDLMSILKPKSEESFGQDIKRSEAAILIHDLMARFGLLYDLFGKLIKADENQIVIELDTDQIVAIPLSFEFKCIKDGNELSVSEFIDQNVFLILNSSRKCVLLQINKAGGGN